MKDVLHGGLRAIRVVAVALSTLVTLVGSRTEGQPITLNGAAGSVGANSFAVSPLTIATDSAALINPWPSVTNYAHRPITDAALGEGGASNTQPLNGFRTLHGPKIDARIGAGNDVHQDLGDTAAPAFMRLNLNASSGPFADVGAYSNSSFTNVAPTLGAFTFGSVLDRQFRAVVGTTITPEPATIVLVGLGLGAVIVVPRWRRRSVW